jgi:hypothetical protein
VPSAPRFGLLVLPSHDECANYWSFAESAKFGVYCEQVQPPLGLPDLPEPSTPRISKEKDK